MRCLAVVSLAGLTVTAPALAQPTTRVEPRPPIQGIAVQPAPQPDLRVTRLVFFQVDCNDSLCLKVAMDMHNSGEPTNGQVDVRISYRIAPAVQWTPLETFHFAPQAHNHDTGASKRFSFQQSGSYCFRADIDPDNKVQRASPTKTRETQCQQYVAGIPDPTPIVLSLKSFSNAFGGVYRIQNVGDGRLNGAIKVAIDCSVNGKPYEKGPNYTIQFTISPSEYAERHWTFDHDPKGVQTLQCRMTITPSFRERTATNNSITSDLWRKP